MFLKQHHINSVDQNFVTNKTTKLQGQCIYFKATPYIILILIKLSTSK